MVSKPKQVQLGQHQAQHEQQCYLLLLLCKWLHVRLYLDHALIKVQGYLQDSREAQPKVSDSKLQ
jgi:hypothetical protein